MDENKFTQKQVLNLLEKQFVNFYRKYGSDMSCGEKMMFKEVFEMVCAGMEYQMGVYEGNV